MTKDPVCGGQRGRRGKAAAKVEYGGKKAFEKESEKYVKRE